MDAETGKQQEHSDTLHLVRLRLEEKLQDFKDYIDDSIDYWCSLKKKFDPDVAYNHQNLQKHWEELNAFDREACKEALDALQRDSQFKIIPPFFLRYASMKVNTEHFEKKIDNRKNNLKNFELILEALDTEDVGQVFLSQLSQYMLYVDSRSRAIISDPSPVFSAFANQYEEYDAERIRGEITKNDMPVKFFKSFYPFVKENREIQKFLSYCPMLSRSLNDPSSIIDLDAFCLDAIIIKSHGRLPGGKDVQKNFSQALKDIQFMERTFLPIKTLSHSLAAHRSETSVQEESIHRMLSNTDVIHLNITHYTTACDLLHNNLPPTVRYDNIITALENLGIKVEARGNGDYRKLLLPNDRKIFIYRPAVPQVGQRFLTKLRKELLEKWRLTPKNLAVNHQKDAP